MPSSGSARARTATAAAPRREPRVDPPHLEVVAPGTRRKLRLRILGGLAATLLFGALLGLAVFHSMLVQGQLGLDRADKEIQQEQTRQRELRQQVAQLGAPERILAAAAALGMVQPDSREYLPAVVPGSVVPPPKAGG
jgi:cell division protein FtsL